MHKKYIMVAIVILMTFAILYTVTYTQDIPNAFRKAKSIALQQELDLNGFYSVHKAAKVNGEDVTFWFCYIPEHKMTAIVKVGYASTTAIEYWEPYDKYTFYVDGDRTEVSKKRAIAVADQYMAEADGKQPV